MVSFHGVPYGQAPSVWGLPKHTRVAQLGPKDIAYGPGVYRFSAIDKKTGCQDGSIEFLQKQASAQNCLRLDVSLPEDQIPTGGDDKIHPEPAPVVVYFPGSCFAHGETSDGEQFVRNIKRTLNQNVVYVSLQFRAGALGYSGSVGLADYEGGKGQGDGLMANWAMHDSRLALQWLQRHIHSFNGDPNRVTIWGQSV